MKILSGGQTGVDRAALDVALELGLPCGGWCPRHRRDDDDGPIPAHYPLRETPSPRYGERTELNVIHSNATFIIRGAGRSPGTALTERLANRHGRPCYVWNLDKPRPDQLERAVAWFRRFAGGTVNVAGSRARSRPGVAGDARRVLRAILAALPDDA